MRTVNVKMNYNKMHSLTLPIKYKDIQRSSVIWGDYLPYCLAKSKNFKIEYFNFPSIKCYKKNHIKYFKIDNNLILIDDWDHSTPTSLINDEFFKINPFYKDTKYLLKVQYENKHIDTIYKKLKDNYGIKVIPGFIFPRSDFELECHKWENKEYEWKGFLTGIRWRNRIRWFKEFEKYPNYFYIHKNEEEKQWKKANWTEKNFYKKLLKNSKWGIILKGKGSGGKNRREIEFMSCGMPIALNYKPNYPFDFKPNIHYLYLETEKDINRLLESDPEPFSEQSKQIYKNHLSVDGVTKTFINLLK